MEFIIILIVLAAMVVAITFSSRRKPFVPPVLPTDEPERVRDRRIDKR